MASTPSEVSTFYRRLATSLYPRTLPAASRPITRTFVSSSQCQSSTNNPNIASDKGTQQGPMSGDKVGGSRVHALDKGGKKDANVQSEQSAGGREYVPRSQRTSQPKAQSKKDREEEWRSFPYLNLRSGDEAWRQRFNPAAGSRQHDADDGEHELTYASYRRSRVQDVGGQATREKDERSSTARAKKEFPEAPDVVIGMQDERGGKGV